MLGTKDIAISISDGPLAPGAHRASGTECGAWLVFEGIVRGEEDGRAIRAIRYAAYEPMAQNELARLAESVSETHGLDRVVVEHARGEVPAGACSFRLSIASGHRKGALAAMDEFIDRMKQDVPIWKEPIRA